MDLRKLRATLTALREFGAVEATFDADGGISSVKLGHAPAPVTKQAAGGSFATAPTNEGRRATAFTGVYGELEAALWPGGAPFATNSGEGS